MLHPIFEHLLKPFSGAVNTNFNSHSTERLRKVPNPANKREFLITENSRITQDLDDLGGDAA